MDPVKVLSILSWCFSLPPPTFNNVKDVQCFWGFSNSSLILLTIDAGNKNAFHKLEAIVHPIKVHTDHKSVEVLQNTQSLTRFQNKLSDTAPHKPEYNLSQSPTTNTPAMQ
ncbi:hypothetical protein E2320_010161, partial [Naja naja]